LQFTKNSKKYCFVLGNFCSCRFNLWM